MKNRLIDHVGNSENILFVDDEKAIIEMYREVFSNMGYRITTASSGYEAIDIICTNPATFSCIITDYKMSGMDGLMLADKIRALPSEEHTPIVLCSGFTDLHDLITERKLKRVWFIHKPFTFKELFVLVKTILTINKIK